MKKIYLNFILFFLISINANAQWVSQPASNLFENRCIYMTSSSEGYIVGSDGYMLRTTDAGLNWYDVLTNTSDTLRTVFFTNKATGYIAGANGTLRRTDDSSATWTGQVSGVSNLLRSLYFVNDTVGYACGGGGVILKTTDGGNNWALQTSGITQDLINIRFANADTGYAVSSMGTFMNGLVLKTTDGGTTWTTIYTNTYGLLGLAVKGDVIYAGGGYQTIVKSSDAGSSWTQVNPSSATASHFRSASFITVDTGYVTGDAGMIYYTTDGGATWANQGINTLGVLSVFALNSDTVYACGASGNILRYTKPCTPAQAAGIIGSAAICAYDTESYYVAPVQGPVYYKWQVPSGATILSGQGDTLITVKFGSAAGVVAVLDTNACGSSAPTNLVITVKAAPPVPTITQNGATLTSSSLVGNQWYLNGSVINGAVNQTYSITQNGTYMVIVTFTNGCSAISSSYNVVNAGIAQNNFDESNLAIVPNPVIQVAELNFQLLKTSNVTASIYDVMGNKVLYVQQSNSNAGKQKIAFDCSQLVKGIYFVKLEFNGEATFRKFEKE